MPTLLALLVLASVGGCPKRPSDTVASTAPDKIPQDTLEGDYTAMHEVFAYDPETDESVSQGETRDTLSIRNASNDALHVKVELVGYNYDTCFFDDAMEPSGPHQWRFKGGDMHPECEVILVRTPTAIVITSNWDCQKEFCGHRSTLEGTFPLSDWEPPGSVEWPER